MDLTELSKTIDANRGEIWDDALNLARLFDLIYTLPKPTMAVVNGPAVAGGAGLVSVCDLAVAAADAKFGYPEVRRGLVAALIMPHLLRHVGELLSGELIDADAAVRCGLINAVVPADRLHSEADSWVRSLAAGGPEALANTKAILHRLSHQALSIDEVAQASATPRLNDECRAGLKAYFAKQPPPWDPSPP
jgi:methylglutaconyl-CoA hydratase